MTNAELERLAILAEECSEVIQIVNKIIRHGYESYNPFDESKTTNRKLLEKELGDLRYATMMLFEANDIEFGEVTKAADNKEESIKKYLHFNL